MKKIAMLCIFFAPFVALAQKDVKPSISKAEKALRTKKLDEAKAIIDVTVANQEFMVEKKGGPSKNAASAWYMRGVIYASIDTSKSEQVRSLAPDAFNVAKESFDKSMEIDKGKTPSFINDTQGLVPLFPAQVSARFADSYRGKADNANKAKDYRGAFDNLEKTLYFSPDDTLTLMYNGVYFGPAIKEVDASIAHLNRYVELKGNDPLAYQQLMSLYHDDKKDNEKALGIIKTARVKFPNNTDFPKFELNIYLEEKKYDLARRTVKRDIKANPNDKESYYLLGQLNEELNNTDSAKFAFEKAVSIDPEYFDANLRLAQLFYADGKKIKQQRDRLGITPAEISQRKNLLDKQRQEYKIALPYWEKCEKLKPEDATVLYTLSDIYNSLVMDDQTERINKKIKTLGLDN
jgi:tetratricopeptide (TPR) repeat protein